MGETKIYSRASGSGYLRGEYVDRPWVELRWWEKIGKKVFKGRYFYPCVKDVIKGYEVRHGRYYRANPAKRSSQDGEQP